MAKLSYTPDALQRIGAIHRYIAEELKNPSGAARIVSMIRDGIRLLKTSPELGPLLSSRYGVVPESLKNTRYFIISKDYIVLYDFDGKTVRIIQIYHTAQDYVRYLFS